MSMDSPDGGRATAAVTVPGKQNDSNTCACCYENPGEVTQNVSEVDGPRTFTLNEVNCRYAMTHAKRGLFIIINNTVFDAVTKMKGRSGSDKDAENLDNDFKKLGFDVRRYDNKKASQMLALMTSAADEMNKAREFDCFGLAVLSHGDDGVLFGTDGIISINNLLSPIKECEALVTKPKIFIFQACRGTQLDDGMMKTTDGSDPGGELSKPIKPIRVPFEADCLYAFSTVQCYFSWRNAANGSWFVQSLHNLITRCLNSAAMNEIDIIQLLTRVNHDVAYDFESTTTDHRMRWKKQIPSIVSMLTKELVIPIRR